MAKYKTKSAEINGEPAMIARARASFEEIIDMGTLDLNPLNLAVQVGPEIGNEDEIIVTLHLVREPCG